MVALWVYLAVCMIEQLRAQQHIGTLCNTSGKYAAKTWHLVICMSAAGHSTQYLVKWKGLGYDEATWESEDDLLPKFAAELTRFQAVHPIIDEHADRKRSHFQVLM